jgi:hypothetical protein
MCQRNVVISAADLKNVTSSKLYETPRYLRLIFRELYKILMCCGVNMELIRYNKMASL